jgi:hypothetical protein
VSRFRPSNVDIRALKQQQTSPFVSSSLSTSSIFDTSTTSQYAHQHILSHRIRGFGSGHSCAWKATAIGALAMLYDVTLLYPGHGPRSLTLKAFKTLPSTVLWNHDVPLNFTSVTEDRIEGSKGASATTRLPVLSHYITLCLLQVLLDNDTEIFCNGYRKMNSPCTCPHVFFLHCCRSWESQCPR